MKHLDANGEDLLEGLLAAAGIRVPAAAQSLMLRHLDWVLEQNLTLNLTRVTDPAEAIRLHAVDSLMVLPEVSDSPSGMVIDLGSGAGFPGVPLALATRRRALLLDSAGKKARAVSQFLRDAGLADLIGVVPSRAEEVDTEKTGRASVVVARAVSTLPSLVELASPLLADGGRLVAMKGRAEDVEVRRGEDAGEQVGMHLLAHREYVLPLGGEARSVYVYERTGESPVRVPRRTGLAQRRPLA